MFIFSELKPTELYLNRLFIENYATKWRNIGLELNVSSGALDNIEVNYPIDVEACCKAMLKIWLQRDNKATWGKLLHAVAAANKCYHITSVETG